MDPRTEELKSVMKKQVELYDEMARSVWGDRLLMAITASGLAGMGFGMLFARRWRTRILGSMFYAGGIVMELYAAMTPKHEAERRGGTRAAASAAEGGEEEVRAA